jgi:hypothetical protein
MCEKAVWYLYTIDNHPTYTPTHLTIYHLIHTYLYHHECLVLGDVQWRPSASHFARLRWTHPRIAFAPARCMRRGIDLASRVEKATRSVRRRGEAGREARREVKRSRERTRRGGERGEGKGLGYYYDRLNSLLFYWTPYSFAF